MLLRTIFLFYFILLPATSIASSYYAGSWTSNISPQPEERLNSCLGGYGAPFFRCGITKVNNPITVDSLYISDDDTEVFLVVLDSIGIGDSLISEIKEYAFGLLGGTVDKKAFQIIATHTHSGPDLQGLWGGIDSNYRQRIIEAAGYSIFLSKLSSMEVDINAITLSNKNNVINRRGWDIVDSDINILDITAKDSQYRLSTLVNLSAHVTILDETNLKYSAGYVHFLREKIEKELGGNTIFINGIVGDAEPLTDGRSVKEARKWGRKNARKVIKAIKNTQPDYLYGDLTLDTYEFNHPVTNQGILGAVQLGLLDLDLNSDLTVSTQYSILSFGHSASAILFPGEALSRLGLPIKESMNTKHKLFFGLTGDSLGYFIPSDEFLGIEGRTTEEAASLDVFIGDEIKSEIISTLENN